MRTKAFWQTILRIIGDDEVLEEKKTIKKFEMPGRNRFIDHEVQERSVPPPHFYHADCEFVLLVQRCRMIYRTPAGVMPVVLEKQLAKLVVMQLKQSGYPFRDFGCFPDVFDKDRRVAVTFFVGNPLTDDIRVAVSKTRPK